MTRLNLIRHFPVFLAAAEEEHFHRAAKRLGVAQSAVSRRIGLLEDDLGGVRSRRDQAACAGPTGQDPAAPTPAA
ncbi:LysR family transcriptional regulator [Phenylobacterium sp.]|uniref:helix-turn-helix domain-containing protein n=1 Tax=Phenylobacterium sp. TaxID=1871053 RepID=UPI002F41EE91